ncbi:MAG TPA: S41 family peptidase [Flavitalea sp.]|nr:S41 family peptidase [Flavitalea sp.]
MRKSLLITSVFVSLVFSLWAQDSIVFTPAQLKQDLNVFRMALVEAHPGLYRYQAQKDVQAQFTAAEKQLNRGMTEEAFYRVLNPLVANIHCAHTKFHREGKPDDPYSFHQKGLFPLKLYFQPGEGVYALSSYVENPTIEPGSEILQINGRGMAEIRDLLFRQVTADGYVTSSKYQELNQHFPGYYSTFIGTADSFTIDYKNKGSDRVATVKLPAAVLSQVNKGLPGNASDLPFHLSFPEPGIALMKIDVFMSPEDQFEEFLKSSFNELKTKNISHLILDLRDNEGGMDRFGVRLYAWLTNSPFRYYDHLSVASMPPYSFAKFASLPEELDQLKAFIKKEGNSYVFTQHPNLGIQQPEPNSFSGKLYVLQNGRSLSVTSEFAAIVRDNKRGVFLGEESGGAISGNNSGGFAMIKLPNTHLGLDIPLLGYYMYLQQQHEQARGILPEHTVNISVNDILQRTDPVIEKALQLIHDGQ